MLAQVGSLASSNISNCSGASLINTHVFTNRKLSIPFTNFNQFKWIGRKWRFLNEVNVASTRAILVKADPDSNLIDFCPIH
jgi:hypothetical protein